MNQKCINRGWGGVECGCEFDIYGNATCKRRQQLPGKDVTIPSKSGHGPQCNCQVGCKQKCKCKGGSEEKKQQPSVCEKIWISLKLLIFYPHI